MNFFHGAKNVWHNGIETAQDHYWIDVQIEMPNDLHIKLTLHFVDSSVAIDAKAALEIGGIFEGDEAAGDISLAIHNVKMVSVGSGASEGSKHLTVTDRDMNADTYCIYL